MTWKSIRITLVVMLEAKNIGITVGILLLSRIQAEINIISYALSVTGRHFLFLTHLDTRQCLDQCNRLA